MKPNDPLFMFEGHIEHATDKAVLVYAEEGHLTDQKGRRVSSTWIPKSQLHEDSIKEPGEQGVLMCSQWFGSQRGWCDAPAQKRSSTTYHGEDVDDAEASRGHDSMGRPL